MTLYEKCASISEELRAISGELKKPLISAVQAGRQGGGYAHEDISFNNVGESAGIPATADAMFALYQNDADREHEQIGVKILKNRLGGFVNTSFFLHVNYETLRITNFTDSYNSNSNDNNNKIEQQDNLSIGPSIHNEDKIKINKNKNKDNGFANI